MKQKLNELAMEDLRKTWVKEYLQPVVVTEFVEAILGIAELWDGSFTPNTSFAAELACEIDDALAKSAAGYEGWEAASDVADRIRKEVSRGVSDTLLKVILLASGNGVEADMNSHWVDISDTDILSSDLEELPWGSWLFSTDRFPESRSEGRFIFSSFLRIYLQSISAGVIEEWLSDDSTKINLTGDGGEWFWQGFWGDMQPEQIVTTENPEVLNWWLITGPKVQPWDLEGEIVVRYESYTLWGQVTGDAICDQGFVKRAVEEQLKNQQ